MAAVAGGAGGGRDQAGLARAASAGASVGTAKLWLDAWSEPMAGLRAFSCCVCTANIAGDGDWRLAVADADSNLKVFQGTARAGEVPLPDLPTALTSFVPSVAHPRVPLLAVAAGPHVYLYRGLRPHARFTVPLAPGASRAQGPAGSAAAVDDEGACVTCMAAARLDGDEPDAVSRLVVATEDGRLLLLDASGTSVDASFTLPSPAAFLATSGELAGQSCCISAAARNGCVYTVKRGSLSRNAIQLNAQAVGLAHVGKSVVLATMAGALQCYSSKGVRQYSLPLPSAPLTLVPLAGCGPRLARCVALALADGTVRVYCDRALVSIHDAGGGAGPPLALCAGRYARENASLVVITAGGGIDIKVMARSANPDAAATAAAAGLPPDQDEPLDVPRKTRLFVEQMQREREQAVGMHQTFQRDLVRLRLATARAYVRALTDGQGAAAQAAGAPLALSASVLGLGPRFRLLLHVTNEGDAIMSQLQMLVIADNALTYHVHAPHVVLPALVPLVPYALQVDVTSLQPGITSGCLRVVLLAPSHGEALLRATVHMPACEPCE